MYRNVITATEPWYTMPLFRATFSLLVATLLIHHGKSPVSRTNPATLRSSLAAYPSPLVGAGEHLSSAAPAAAGSDQNTTQCFLLSTTLSMSHLSPPPQDPETEAILAALALDASPPPWPLHKILEILLDICYA